MSRERFNELVEGYALGDLEPDEAREFLKLVEDNHDWAREAQETHEIARIAHAVPAPSAPAGLLAGALREARSRKQDPSTPVVDVLRPSADVILIPGPNGTMRRIPIHGQQKTRDAGVVDPHEGRHRFHINWGFAATAAAVLVLGSLVAFEIGPNLVGRSTTQQTRDEENRYLASATRYEMDSRESLAGQDERAQAAVAARKSAPAAPNAAAVGDEGMDVASMAALEDDPAANTSSRGDLYRVQQEGQIAGLGKDSLADEAPMEVAMVAPSSETPALDSGTSRFSEDSQDAAKMAEAEYFSGAGAFMAPTPAEVRDLDVATIEQKEEAPDEQKLFMARMFGPAKETAESSAIELEAAPVEVARVETAPVATAMTPDPSMRLLSPLEMDFLLAQAKIAGGNVAEPRNVAGFAPAPIEESAEGGRSEIAFLFPDRAAYDVFVTRLRIMPLDDLGQSPRSDRAVASGSGVGGDISRRQRSGMPAGIGQPNGTTPSPVTGFASSQPAPAVSRQESRTASGITPSVPETSASTATLPEGLAFGQPIDLTRYHFHLTTDFESGTLRLNLRPVQPGEKPGGPPSPRTATPVPGARR